MFVLNINVLFFGAEGNHLFVYLLSSTHYTCYPCYTYHTDYTDHTDHSDYTDYTNYTDYTDHTDYDDPYTYCELPSGGSRARCSGAGGGGDPVKGPSGGGGASPTPAFDPQVAVVSIAVSRRRAASI